MTNTKPAVKNYSLSQSTLSGGQERHQSLLHGGYERGGGSRGQRNARCGKNVTRRAIILETRFEGDIKDLSGAYFNCTDNYCYSIYDFLMNIISRYIAIEYVHSVDIRHVLMKMERLTLAVPFEPIESYDTEKDIWKEKVSHYVK